MKSNRILAVGAAVNAVFIMIVLTLAVMRNLAATNVILSFAGSLGVPGSRVVAAAVIMSVSGVIAAVLLAQKCNVLALGDKIAQGLGINLLRTKIAVAAVAVFLATAAAVNVGITAFLGLLAPLAAKKLLGGNHYNLVPLSGFIGGLLLLSADCFGRSLGTPVTLPVGIITTVVGGAVFIVLLKRSYKYAD